MHSGTLVRRGQAKARAHGRTVGRSHTLVPQEATELAALHAAGLTLKVVMRVYGLSKASVCRYLAQARFLDAEAAD
jgi:hypothetical protein